MASKQVSPAAQLLRRSRLFSLPPRLPPPVREVDGATTTFGSDTATLHHPIYQVIQTTETSRARGDWGMKRPLPLKSTMRTSTPLVRVKEVDNIDHITNFESAADHALTLQKWQELNLSLNGSVHVIALSTETTDMDLGHNVFDVFEKRDITRGSVRGLKKPKRWRFAGPWLGGMDNVKFEKYVENEIKRRRPEFRQYLREKIIEAKREAQTKESGHGVESDSAKVTLSEEELQEEILRMRDEQTQLWNHIWTFLDLAGDIKATADQSRGPHRTHPSAGLSYLRTDSHIHNHPHLGPQAHGPPVLGRVFNREVSRPGSNSQQPKHIVGIGGIIADTTSIFRDANKTRSFADRGGSRSYVQPDRPAIDVHGRVIMDARRAEPVAEAVWEYEVPHMQMQANREAADIEQQFSPGSKSGNRSSGLFWEPDELLKKAQNRAIGS